jgi:predicted glycosyltransferase
VIVVGNGYVEYLAGTGTRLERGQYKKKYARTIVVTAQYTVESKLVEFIRKAASLASDSLFLYVPRDATNKYEGIFPKNVRVITSSNAYELIKQADFHATVYSTCAMEAPFFGTPNILININGKSKECFEKVLTDPETTRYVNTEEEFVRLVSTWERLEPAEIKLRHKGFIQTGYVQEIKKAVERIGGKKDDM